MKRFLPSRAFDGPRELARAIPVRHGPCRVEPSTRTIPMHRAREAPPRRLHIRVPARRYGDADAPLGKVIDQRPFFGDANRVMQWQDDAAGAQLHASGDHG